jgi:hypothetical protein
MRARVCRIQGITCLILSYLLHNQQLQQVEAILPLVPVVAAGVGMGIYELIKLLGPCEKNKEKRETSPGVWTCQYCHYGMHDPDSKGCVFCPQNTLVTAGRHYSSIIDWCEADCYKAFSQVMEMDHYTRAWYISSFANVPCVSSMYTTGEIQGWEIMMEKCKRGDEHCKQLNTKCSSEDNYWVKNSVIRWRGPDFPQGAESGNRYRVCELCPKGTYRHKDKKTCTVCPNGFVGAEHGKDDSSLFIPFDVQEATKKTITQTSTPADYLAFGCRACSASEGVSTLTGTYHSCVKCTNFQYQVEIMVTFEHPTAGQLTYEVGMACGSCLYGYEFFNKLANDHLTPCRSAKHEDCCRPCKENQFSSGGPKCQNIPGDEVGIDFNQALVAFGANQHRPCKLGEELIYCRNSECSNRYNAGKFGWRTCKPCSLSGTKIQIAKTGCGECKDEGKDLPIQGNADKCTHCSLCSKLEIKIETVTLHVIPADILDKHNMNSMFSSGTYLTEKTTADCKPLERRLVFDVAGATQFSDQYRKNLQDSTVYAVPSFYTILREFGNCTLKKCSEVCDGIFEYSPGCGPQVFSPDDMWVLSGENKVPLKSVTDVATLQKGMYVTNGPCKVCKTCERGYYNDQCNTYRDGVDPQGVCKLCKSTCGADEYMHHRDGDGR